MSHTVKTNVKSKHKHTQTQPQKVENDIFYDLKLLISDYT